MLRFHVVCLLLLIVLDILGGELMPIRNGVRICRIFESGGIGEIAGILRIIFGAVFR